MKTELFSWGRYPRVEAENFTPKNELEALKLLRGMSDEVTPRGLARSYGDSALGDITLSTNSLDRFISFDSTTGIVRCESGVSLDEILKVFVPRGWFLPVTPGTRFVSVGGAIACDVHGKNHHVEGTFCDHVLEMNILLGDGSKVVSSPSQNSELFHATCGGMGLTGVILDATIKLKPITSSLIEETTYKCANLDEVITRFEETKDFTYSVAWIDCLATGKHLGRSLLMVGEHATSGELVPHKSGAIPIPIEFPAFLMNKFTMSLFNFAYYNKAIHKVHTRLVPYAPFFYPLDVASDWNKLYGKPGFLQYQFVLPFSAGVEGLREILQKIAASGKGSMLAVLKVFGQKNDNHLSFPMEGYTLALDFKVEPAIFPLLEELDALVLKNGGRLYLTKDARMSEETFKNSYPRWSEFESVRKRYSAVGKFSSKQSKRLGLK